MKRTHKMQTLGASLPGVLASHLQKRSAEEAFITSHWHQLCPKIYASNSVPLSLKQGVLTVAVTSSSAAGNLEMWSPVVMSGINTLMGYEAVHKVRFKQQSFKAA